MLKTFAKLYDKNQKDVREYGQISKLPPEESKESISKNDLFLEKINQLDPNEMTPLKALETLYTLKAWAVEISSDNTLK